MTFLNLKIMKFFPSLLLAAAAGFTITASAETVELLHNVVFYDGYKTDEVVDAALEDGVVRHQNSLYATRIDPAIYPYIGDNLRLEATLHARCDNYDRMAKFHLAFVPKDAGSYSPGDVRRIEIARFITPFMNKNRKPKEVPYTWDIPNVAYIFHDPAITGKYDIWLEAYVFGVPYDAQKHILGCAQRNDVFSVDASFVFDKDGKGEYAEPGRQHLLTPVYTTKSELEGNVNFNSYNEKACDRTGVCERTFTFSIEDDLDDAFITLINSNHGAGENGEEYVRRLHNIYVDGNLLLTYTPGGVSCEPYRQYNTQGNGIYGKEPTDDWEEWNNWCPGQAVPIRYINLGALTKGEHSIKLQVPDAEFYNNDGDFRPSIYVQGLRKGSFPMSSVRDIFAETDDLFTFGNRDGGVAYSCRVPLRDVCLFDANGILLEGHYSPDGFISLESRPAGVYFVAAYTRDGRSSVFKTVK